jgi:hypothetical protein
MNFSWRPRPLLGVLEPVLHGDDFDRDSGNAVGNWVRGVEPASSLAADKAEKYLHDCLEQAARKGAEAGRSAYWRLVLVPSLVLVALAFAFSLIY